MWPHIRATGIGLAVLAVGATVYLSLAFAFVAAPWAVIPVGIVTITLVVAWCLGWMIQIR